jgi:hypothetical protein
MLTNFPDQYCSNLTDLRRRFLYMVPVQKYLHHHCEFKKKIKNSVSYMHQLKLFLLQTYPKLQYPGPTGQHRTCCNHDGNTMRKIMRNKPQVSSAIIIHSPLQISWNDLLYQGQTADVSIIRAKTGTFRIETLGPEFIKLF